MGSQKALMRREMLNNPRTRESIVARLEDIIGPLVRISSRPNAAYGVSNLNRGMACVAVLDAFVGGCANGMHTAHTLFGLDVNPVVPSDEWFRTILSSVD